MMAYSVNTDLNEYLAANDGPMTQDDEFMQSIKPHVDDTIQMPEKYIFQHSMIDTPGKVVESEITKLLRITPGILPPVDQFPKSYKPPKPVKLPDFIPKGKQNKIPILFNEKFFKLQHDGDESKNERKNVCGIMNNLDCAGGGGNKKFIGRNIQNRVKGIDSSGSSRTHASIEVLEKYFHTVFCDDTSDEDNCNVDSSADSTIHQN